MLIGTGDRLIPQSRQTVEPHTGWRRSPNQEKTLGLPLVYMPARHDPSRAIWRGLESMPPKEAPSQRKEGAKRLTSAILDWISELVSCVRPASRPRLRAPKADRRRGVRPQKSVIAEVVDDALSMQGILLGRAEHLVGAVESCAVESCVKAAENAARCLGTLAGRLAVAARGDVDAPRAAARASAYAERDRPFRAWVADLHEGSDAGMEQARRNATARDVVRELAADLLRRAGPSWLSWRPCRC